MAAAAAAADAVAAAAAPITLLLPLVAQMFVTPRLVFAALQLTAQLLLLTCMPAEGLLKLHVLTPGSAPPQLRPVKQLLLLGDCRLLWLPPACMLRRSLLVLW
jgi:hypothetical protein